MRITVPLLLSAGPAFSESESQSGDKLIIENVELVDDNIVVNYFDQAAHVGKIAYTKNDFTEFGQRKVIINHTSILKK